MACCYYLYIIDDHCHMSWRNRPYLLLPWIHKLINTPQSIFLQEYYRKSVFLDIIFLLAAVMPDEKGVSAGLLLGACS